MNATPPRFYEFGPFRLDVRERLLMREQQLVSLPLKVFETLLVLIEHHGCVLEKSELVKRLWPNTHIGNNSLAQNIFTLRKVLGGEHERFIETMPKRGYRFIAPVKACDNENLATNWRTASRGGELDPVNDVLPIRLLAVLPFKSLSEDAEGNYLGVGLADALITRLSNLEGVIVRPTSAVLSHSSVTEDLILTGQELGVDSILDGRIQKSGDKIRVTAQLVNAHNGAPLWAGKFDGDLANIFSLQDAISERVAHALLLKLSSAAQTRQIRRETENTAAYQLYLKGRFHWNQRTSQALLKAIECFKQAIERDPQYALAYAGLADCYILLDIYSPILPPKESYTRGLAAATRALEIEPRLVEAVTALALISAFFEWDWEKAEQGFERALALNSNYATAYHWYAEYLIAMNRSDEAIAAIIRAQEMEPLSLIINCNVGFVFSYARKYDLAIEQLQQTLEMDPHFFVTYRELGLVYGQKGMYKEAITALQSGAALCPGHPYLEALLGYTYALAGRNKESQQKLDWLRAESMRKHISPYLMAMVHCGRAEDSLAFECLNRALEERTTWLIHLAVNPIFDRLRKDARFARVLRRMRLGGSDAKPVASKSAGARKQ